MCRAGQGRNGAEILQRVYYEYATSYFADQAAADLSKIPEEPSLPPVTYAAAPEASRLVIQGATLSALPPMSIATWSILLRQGSSQRD